MFRDLESGDLIANFGDTNSVLCGARMPHLSGKRITLAKKLEDGTVQTFWENIYPSLK